MWHFRRWLLLVALLMTACGETPHRTLMGPTPTTGDEEQAPEIVSATVSPDVCVPGLTTLQAHVVARGSGTLTYSWTFGNGPSVATTADATFSCAGQSNHDGVYVPVTIAVADGKGHGTRRDVGYAAGDLNDSFYGRIGSTPGVPGSGHFYSVALRRTGHAVTGTISDSAGHYGTVDPAEPGYLGADGSFRIRFKLESDFVFVGKLVFDPTFKYQAAYYGTGHVEGGEFDGQSFYMQMSVN
jgi:hypothetical protein